MRWNVWIRKAHRWVSIAFTAAVIVNIGAMGQGEPAVWIGLLALFPLVLLLVSGLWLFVLPYVASYLASRSRASGSLASRSRG